MRGVSTVLDVSLCLLLVTASALTLVAPLRDDPNPNVARDAAPDTADETCEVLTTATASVTYEVDDRNRTAHDTLAGLLASATLADANSASALAFRSAVTERVARALRSPDASVQVVAAPESGLSTDETLLVGPSPPRDADVHAASVEVRGVRLTARTWSG